MTLSRAYDRPALKLGAVLVLSFLLLASGANAARAQAPSERTSSRIRARCQAAASAVQRANNATAAANDLHTLAWCSESAGGVVPALWHTAPHDSAGLSQLLLVSHNIRDARIHRAVDAVARDPKQQAEVRRAAMVVLASYADPSITGRVTGGKGGRGDAAVGFARVDHTNAVDGAEPLSPAVRSEVLSTLRQIQASESRGEVRSAATYLLRALAPPAQ